MDQNHGNINCKSLTVDGFEAHSQQYNLTTGGTNWNTPVRAVGYVYSVSDGAGGTIWRMSFNIVGSFSIATPTPEVTIDGVSFKNYATTTQSITASCDGGGAVACSAFVGNTIKSIFGDSFGSAKTLWFFSGDVELDLKPTFVA